MSDDHTVSVRDLFEEPDTFPGASTRMLSPAEALALAEPCGVAGALSDAFGLIEAPVEAVTKRGVKVAGQFYIHEYLLPWTTGDTTIRPDFYVRYDRALAARGVLREVELLREFPDGSRRVVAVCIRDADYADRCSYKEFREYRREALQSVIKDMERLERAYLSLEMHDEALESFYAVPPENSLPKAEAKHHAPGASGRAEERGTDAERQAATAGALADDEGSSKAGESLTGSDRGVTSRSPEPDGVAAADMLGDPNDSGPKITHDGSRRSRRRRN